MRKRFLVFIFAALVANGWRETGAQSAVVVRAARSDTLTAEPGATVTAVFKVTNSRAQAVLARPRIAVPNGWVVVIGAAPFDVAARNTDTWLVGISLPVSAAAGNYVVRVGVAAGATDSPADSVVVRVDERRGIDVHPGNGPTYAMSGKAYEVRFLVHNRGNVPATFLLGAVTSAGSPCPLDRTQVTVQPGGTTTIAARVASDAVGHRSSENVVELRAVDGADTTVSASASLRTTIVPQSRSWLNQLSTVPAELTVRAAGPGSGVSPAALAGGGDVGPGGSARFDFLFRAPVDGPSLFGERDEYRVALATNHVGLRLGDNLYGFSQLSSSWMSGFGGELRAELAGLEAGAYVRESRLNRSPGSERALLLGTSPHERFSISAIGVDRTSGRTPGGRKGALAGHARLAGWSLLEVEGALSDSLGSAGEAHHARLSGEVSRLSYDLSLTRGTPTFAGRDRGQTSAHAGVTARLATWASFSGNSSTLSFMPVLDAGSFNQLQTTSVEGDFIDDRISLGYEQTRRANGGVSSDPGGGQQGVRVRGSLPLGPLSVYADLAEGVTRGSGLEDRRYESFAMTLRASLGAAGMLEFFGQRSAGMVFQSSGVSGGTTATLQLPRSTSLTVSAYGTLPAGQSNNWFAQADAELSHQLSHGPTLVVRDRVTNYGWSTIQPRSHLIFFELRAPLKIPTGLVRPVGQARGKIVDEGGRGVAGVLVRLGREAAVSDASGRVLFESLLPGRYPVSIDVGDSRRAADALLAGDVAVDVSPGASRPAEFALSFIHRGELLVRVRRLDFASTLGDATRDSLVDAGGFPSAMIALVGVRDTIFQTTNEAGVADFRDLPAGRWSVRVIAEPLPESHALERGERDVVVRPGARSVLAFEIIPKRRAVQFMEPPPPVFARPAHAPSPTSSPIRKKK
jgi:hypothetical protein